MNDLAIETQSLHKHYGALHAVDGINMHVPVGSIYGFIGRNGAGKTTTIRMLAGLAHSTSGQMLVLGHDPRTNCVPILERTGFVIDKNLLPSMTGEDMVRFHRSFYPHWSNALVSRYAEALEVPMKQKFRKLSSGNQTKLCLLLALSQGADLLMLDEPTAGLDPIVIDQLIRVLVDDFASEGRTTLLSSHHLSEVERVADWIDIIDHGKMLLEARLDDVRANFRRIRAVGEDLPRASGSEIVTAKSSEGTTEYVLRANAEGFARQLRSQGAILLDVTPMNLSEIFIELVGKEDTHVPVEVLA